VKERNYLKFADRWEIWGITQSLKKVGAISSSSAEKVEGSAM
jgi:hypothetical protein